MMFRNFSYFMPQNSPLSNVGQFIVSLLISAEKLSSSPKMILEILELIHRITVRGHSPNNISKLENFSILLLINDIVFSKNLKTGCVPGL